MSFADGVGSVAVLLLLIAFSTNLFGFLPHTSRIYQGLNLLGAGLACYASLLISYFPFVILEGAWALVALVGLIRSESGPLQPSS